MSRTNAHRTGLQTEALLTRYMDLHYGRSNDALAARLLPVHALHFPVRTAQLVTEFSSRTDRALDIGCAVGRATFELTRTFEKVIGVDISGSFIDEAQQVRKTGAATFFIRNEGELRVQETVLLDPSINRERATFRQADVCSLPADWVGFDAVLMANVIECLPNPRACLELMGGSRGLVRPGGVLVITSPYGWIEDETPREAWLGGFVRDGTEIRSIDGVRAALGAEFEMVCEREMPLAIREHRRKYDFMFAHATVWRRDG
jgi:putative 4-mercaptohistidine N1-methyltranferase